MRSDESLMGYEGFERGQLSVAFIDEMVWNQWTITIITARRIIYHTLSNLIQIPSDDESIDMDLLDLHRCSL